MPIAFSNIRRTGVISWEYSWAPTAVPYRIYNDGKLIATINDTKYTIDYPGAISEPPILEVLDANDTATAEQLLWAPRIILQWRVVSGAARYYIKRYVAAAWTVVGFVEQANTGYLSYHSGVLDDVTAEQWRVTSVDMLGNESAVVGFSLTLVRNPDAPAITMAYDKPNSEIDIAAA